MATALGSVVDFLISFGFFDVILPFLLVFSIVFGILEKTKIFGVEKVGDQQLAKKSINSMVAFVIAFFTIAAKEVVSSLQVSLPQVTLILIIIVCFLMLAGSFMSSEKEFSLANSGWVGFLTFVLFLAVLLIFLNSFGWLDPMIAYAMANFGAVIVPIIFLFIVVGTVVYIVGGKKPAEEKKDKAGSG